VLGQRDRNREKLRKGGDGHLQTSQPVCGDTVKNGYDELDEALGYGLGDKIRRGMIHSRSTLSEYQNSFALKRVREGKEGGSVPTRKRVDDDDSTKETLIDTIKK
jgi:hypothetical protein